MCDVRVQRNLEKVVREKQRPKKKTTSILSCWHIPFGVHAPALFSFVCESLCLPCSLWSLSHLLGHSVPLLVTNAHVHALFVEELAPLRDQEDIAHKVPH